MFDDDDFLSSNAANPFEKPSSATASGPAGSPPPAGTLAADSSSGIPSYTGGQTNAPPGTDGTVQDYLNNTGGNLSPGGGGNGAVGNGPVDNNSLSPNANGIVQLPDNIGGGGSPSQTGNVNGTSPTATGTSGTAGTGGDQNTMLLRQLLESSLRQEETLQKLCNAMINLNTRVVDLEQRRAPSPALAPQQNQPQQGMGGHQQQQQQQQIQQSRGHVAHPPGYQASPQLGHGQQPHFGGPGGLGGQAAYEEEQRIQQNYREEQRRRNFEEEKRKQEEMRQRRLAEEKARQDAEEQARREQAEREEEERRRRAELQQKTSSLMGGLMTGPSAGGAGMFGPDGDAPRTRKPGLFD